MIKYSDFCDIVSLLIRETDLLIRGLKQITENVYEAKLRNDWCHMLLITEGSFLTAKSSFEMFDSEIDISTKEEIKYWKDGVKMAHNVLRRAERIRKKFEEVVE